MFDVGFSELLLLAVVALVVLGPEKLPHAARIAGAWLGRIRRTVSHMQAEIEREVAAQEMKARLEKEFGDAGGNRILDELREEHRNLENTLRDDEAEPAAVPAMSTPVISNESTPSVLAEANTPPEQVKVDGEKAYREWLEAQKQKRTPPSQDDATP